MTSALPIRTLAARPFRPVSEDDFFVVTDAVLARSGRPPLGQRQRNIVQVRDTDEVLQILAGPGAGKTEVLVWRVLYELFVNGTPPQRLMVTTFTRKAAQELSVRMVERSDDFLDEAANAGITADDPHVHDLRIGTLHSLCDQLLTEFDDQHLQAGAAVIDDIETKLRFNRVKRWRFRDGTRQVLDAVLGCDELTCLFRPPWVDTPSGYQQNELTLTILNQHIETWIPRCAAAGTPNGIESVHGIAGLTDDLSFVQDRWAGELESRHVMDYALLQLRFLERQAGFADEIDHVFVDEFQDTNPIQYDIHLGWVRHAHVRLTVVGDDDQALYRWRGSDIGCFAHLQADCAAAGLGYRQEVLEINNRSTANIVRFAREFREATVLASDSLPKSIQPPTGAPAGAPVRLLEGPWGELCRRVAAEVKQLGAGQLPVPGAPAAPTVAVLMASTSEVESRKSTKPALELRRAMEAAGLRVYNPRNKSAARDGSPVHDLLGLISYLIDPVTTGPAGKNGRSVEVWASCNDPNKAQYAISAAPSFAVSPAHAAIQKRLIKRTGAIGAPGPQLRPVIDYLDEIRKRLVAAKAGEARLTLGGLVARLLRMEPFRSSGYTINLFRQALFTQLLEANVAVTRQTRQSLDRPMEPTMTANGKLEWPEGYWSMLSAFGQLVDAGGQDDVEVEAFSEDAIAVLTFHQAKGLEYDHVYVAMTGKAVDPSAVLATELFSGRTPAYLVDGDGRPVTADPKLMTLAEADREREVYVAVTRAKQHLTVLHAPGDGRWAMELNAGLEGLFAPVPATTSGATTTREWTA